MTKRLQAVLLATILATFTVPVLCAPPRDIVVGEVIDESGDNIDASRDYVAGARVYFDFVNAQGGIRGRRVALLVRDDAGAPDRTLAAARELVERQGAQVLFGPVGDASVAALAKSGDLRRWGVALFAPMAGIELDVGTDHVFFLRPTYGTEALRLVGWFQAAVQTRAAIVYSGGEFARASRQAATTRLRADGATLVAEISIGGDGRDAAAVAAKVAATRPQFVLVLADTLAAGQFIKAYRALDPLVAMAGLSNISHQTLIELAGPANAAGVLLTQVVPDPSRGGSAVAREHIALMKRFRDEPASHATLEGFVAAKYLVATLRSIDGEIDRASILAALRARREVGVGGFVITWPDRSNRGSRFADMTLLRKNGTLLQ